LGKNFERFSSGEWKLKIQVRVSSKPKDTTPPNARKKTAPKSGTGVVGASRSEFPQSTNVSSPVQQTARKRKVREKKDSDLPLLPSGYLHNDFVVPDDECDTDPESSDEEAFEPVRIKGVATKTSKKALSAPITTDQEMAALNPIHRDIVEQFLILAKKQSEEVNYLLFQQSVYHHTHIP
jgi:bloom syndrome protein